MFVLQWTRGTLKGEMTEVFNVRWDVRTRKWTEVPNPNARWGFRDPETREIKALKKRDLSYYGVVNEVEVIHEDPDIEVQVEMGTPSLGVVDEEDEVVKEIHEASTED